MICMKSTSFIFILLILTSIFGCVSSVYYEIFKESQVNPHCYFNITPLDSEIETLNDKQRLDNINNSTEKTVIEYSKYLKKIAPYVMDSSLKYLVLTVSYSYSDSTKKYGIEYDDFHIFLSDKKNIKDMSNIQKFLPNQIDKEKNKINLNIMPIGIPKNYNDNINITFNLVIKDLDSDFIVSNESIKLLIKRKTNWYLGKT